jgi:capsular polysaccharide export protein
VHTISSLAGFEALLRGKAVTTYGAPFYAGWGLTTDRLRIPRRCRTASLDELVAAALIVYPLYLDPVTGKPCRVETVIARLAEAAASPPRLSRFALLRALSRALRPLPRLAAAR